MAATSVTFIKMVLLSELNLMSSRDVASAENKLITTFSLN